MKHDKNYPKNKFEPFHLPKNSPFGLLIAFASFLMCFALIWHIWWLLIVGTLALLALLIVRFADEDTEILITKEVVAREQKGVV